MIALGLHQLPVVRQTEAAECGLACLAMTSAYHGHRIDLGKLRREHSISLKGSTLKSLMEIADRLGFTARPVRLELEELCQLKTPAILHWDLNHFVVLKHVRFGRALIHDPALGARSLRLTELSKRFTGVALELTPAPGFEKRDEREPLRLRDLARGARGLKRFLVQLLLVSLGLQALALLSPFYVQLVVDEAVVRQDTTLLSLLAVGFLTVSVLQTIIGWMRSWSVTYLGAQLALQTQGNLLRHLLRLPLSYFHKRHIGDIVSRFGSLSAIQGLFTTAIVEAIVDGLMLVFTLGMLFVYQAQLAALVVAMLMLYGVLRWARYRSLRDLSLDNLKSSAEASSQFLETLRGMATIKLFGLETERLGQWQNRSIDMTNTSLQISRIGLAFGAVNKLLFGAAHITIVYLGAELVIGQSFTVGMLTAFLAYESQFLAAGGGLIDQWISYKLLDIHLERIADIALSETEESMEPTALPAASLPATLRFDNVSFRYATSEPWLLRQVSLDVGESECLGIVGPSGTGKSTLIRLALGLEKPEEGSIQFGGANIARLGYANYRRAIAAVTQEDRLLSGTVAENITLFDSHPDLAWMAECARTCGIHDVILNLPMNYHSLIGDMGDALSAGERQRLMLARALYRRPRILFLDEATSNLDTDLDERINQALAAMKITRVVVTHRQTPLRYADRIYRLPDGLLLPQPAATIRVG